MAYQLNSASDASGHEELFVQKFKANQAKIVAYKQAHGGDLEHAYQAVTGEPWPEGRSVKLKNGEPEMTKDRTVRSVLGKYVLPAAAAVVAPYAIGALAGGGAAAGGAAAGAGAGGVGIGETGATIGLGSLGAKVAPIVKGAAGGLWSKLASPFVTTAITAGTGLLGTKMKVDADKKAAEIEAQAAKEALDWQKGVYAQRQEQLAPAIGVGRGATLALGDLMGIPTPAGGYHAPPPPGPTPVGSGQTPAAAANASAPATPQTVQMRAPTGQVQPVPVDQVEHYKQLGATVVQ